jgi:ankyrin repeat protein
MRDASIWRGNKTLRKTIEILEHVLLGNTNGLPLAGLSHEHRTTGDNMKQLQGIVDLIVEDGGGSTALCLAAETGCEVVTRLLQDTGKVDPNAAGLLDETPLLKAAKKGHEDIVKLLLSTDRIDPDATANRYQPKPLAGAAQNGHEAIVKLLVNTGRVNVNGVSVHGTAPLSYAAGNGYTAIVEFLLSISEVEPDFGYTPEGKCNTALSSAVRYGHEAIVELLLGVSQVPLDFRYNAGYEHSGGCTLLTIAKKKEYKGIIKLLERAAHGRRRKGEKDKWKKRFMHSLNLIVR